MAGLLDDGGSNDLARPTPRGEAVEDHQPFLAEGVVELLLRLQVVHAFAHGCVEVFVRENRLV